ncbi:SPFH domain-containing protein [Paenibacillus sp. HJGM_3]|uniref:SPFH domain-containing protein n=1 Tax=Paenibacillus sp. HJGM_3 TaxID=3379816 RepID=UPI00385F9BD2
MMTFLWILGIIALLALCALIVFTIINSVRIIPQQKVAVIERLGKYLRVLNPGFHLIIPFVDRVRKLHDLRIHQADVPSQMVITKDNVQIKIDTVFFYFVHDAMAATYSINDFVKGIQNITAANIRQVVGNMELDETLAGRERISLYLRHSLEAATGKWGVSIERVEIIDIHPPLEIHHAMEKQMKAEREKRANILQAEGERQAAVLRADGEKQAEILRAEGAKQAMILQAEGQKESNIRIAEGNQLSQELDAKGKGAAIKIIAGADRLKIETIAEAEKIRIDKIKSAEMDPQFLSYKSLEALGEISKGQATTLFVPTEAVNVFSSVGSLSKIANVLNKQAKVEESEN